MEKLHLVPQLRITGDVGSSTGPWLEVCEEDLGISAPAAGCAAGDLGLSACMAEGKRVQMHDCG